MLDSTFSPCEQGLENVFRTLVRRKLTKKLNPPSGGGKTNKMRKLMFSAAAVVASTAMLAAAAGLFPHPNNWKILDRVTLPNGNVNFATRHPDANPLSLIHI